MRTYRLEIHSYDDDGVGSWTLLPAEVKALDAAHARSKFIRALSIPRGTRIRPVVAIQEPIDEEAEIVYEEEDREARLKKDYNL